MSVRDTRLVAELEAMKLFGSDVMRWETIGNNLLPDRYHFHYDLASVSSIDAKGNVVTERRMWTVELVMPANYPWGKPEVRFVGNHIWHPNVWVGGDICIEDRYHAGIGIPLDSLCEHIGQIIAYQKYNLNSPANGDQRLRMWILTHGEQSLPTDTRDIRRPRIVLGSTQNLSAPPSRIKFGS